MSAVVACVPSLSDPRVRYDITRERDGSLRCECQAFASWRKRGLPCWHLRVWQAASAALVRCETAGHGQHIVERDASPDAAYLCERCLLALLAAMAAKVKTQFVARAEVKAAKLAAAEKRKRKQAAKKTAARQRKIARQV